MAERVVLNIVRPEIGVFYEPESPEAGPRDFLAAAYLGIAVLAARIEQLSAGLNEPCHPAVSALARSDAGKLGM